MGQRFMLSSPLLFVLEWQDQEKILSYHSKPRTGFSLSLFPIWLRIRLRPGISIERAVLFPAAVILSCNQAYSGEPRFAVVSSTDPVGTAA